MNFFRINFITILTAGCLLSLISALSGCKSETDEHPTLVVSVEPQQAILEEIVGDRFNVVSVLQPGSNPETFEPTMKTRREIDGAKAFFTTGNLPFEEMLSASLPEGVMEVNVTTGITPLYGTHGHSHGHGHDHGHGEAEVDPHVWASVKNARVIARNMFDAVLTLDPAGEMYYRPRYEALDNRLDSLDLVFSAQLSAPIMIRSFVVWHPSLSYLARDYGLEQISVGFENKEMPASHLAKIIDEAKMDAVKVFFFQQEYDSRQAETLNERMGTRLVTINPRAYEWEKELKKVVDALSR
ncbi:MAG: zinc ABC transporter substrate-binding protein [Muribaculaceae bacterium]|nr:zinc ABC transporter substrate-binding protein [Muribaculaceae bacterium]